MDSEEQGSSEQGSAGGSSGDHQEVASTLSDISNQPQMSTPERASCSTRVPLRLTAAVRPTLLEMSSIGPDEQSMACEHSVLYRTLPTLTGDPYESDEDDFTFYPDQSSSSEDEEEDSHVGLALTLLNRSDSESSASEDESSECTERESGTESSCEFEGVSQADYSVTASTADLLHCSKVVVSVPQLLQLAPSRCTRLNCFQPVTIREQYKGSVLVLFFSCGGGHSYSWSSSGVHLNMDGVPLHANNLLLAAAGLLTGCSFSKVECMFKFMGLHCFSEQMFYRYQTAYLLDPIHSFWKDHQQQVFAQVHGHSLILAGDGRCDSPGTSARYCTDTNLIIHSETVQRHEVAYKSPNMEVEGMRRCLKYLENVTDAATSIIGMLSREFPQYIHSLDIWHKSKKLRKSLLEASKTKGMGVLESWSDNVVNHFWWCCESYAKDVDLLKTKWISILHHVCNEHSWSTGQCEHDELTETPKGRDGATIPYFDKTEPAFQTLQKIVLDARWLQSLKFYVRFRHTGLLEVFHNSLLAYASKRLSFSEAVYNTRLYLAILDHNHHTNRPYRETDGETQFHRVWRRRSKRWDVIPRKTKKTFVYIPELLRSIFDYRAETHERLRNIRGKKRIGSAITPVPPPDTEEIAAGKKTRFAN